MQQFRHYLDKLIGSISDENGKDIKTLKVIKEMHA